MILFNTIILDLDEERILNIMKEIFQEYGGILITVVAILSIILVVTAVIGSDATGIVGKTFSDLITNFSNHANMSVK